MYVTDGAEFEAQGAVKIEDEYIAFTGVSDNTLTGCSAGAYGTTQAYHAAGKSVRQVAAFAEPENGEGLPPDEIFLSLLCDHAGIDPLSMATIDRGAELDQGVSESGVELLVSDTEPFPETGIVRVGDELIRYRGIIGSALQVTERGAYGTTASSHNQGASVLIVRFTEELGRWMSGTRFKRFAEQSISIKDLVNDLREQCLIHLWQAEDSCITAKCLAPPFYTETPQELDDESGFINGSTSWDPGEKLRSTRVTVYYDPIKPDPGKSADSYAGVLVIVDADAESPEYFGEVRDKEIWGNWICREHEALILASRHLIRYRSGAACFKFAVELKDDDLQVGDFVRVTSRDIAGPSGEMRERALFEVIRKQRVSDNRIEIIAMDTRLDKRYPVIAPADITVDYDQADEDDKERFGWIGDEDNTVGAAEDDGYYIY
jgi:hypothetical protein